MSAIYFCAEKQVDSDFSVSENLMTSKLPFQYQRMRKICQTMMTVKELSKQTGISARTLHYYDEIGLFTPTEKSGAGYRLYDDQALERLQQILFFREFDIPLKEIKAMMDNPALDRNELLQMQRKMLVRKKERMERLIANIDAILKGEEQMDFTVLGDKEKKSAISAYDAPSSRIFSIACLVLGSVMLPPFLPRLLHLPYMRL